jgi:hypothetical protein
MQATYFIISSHMQIIFLNFIVHMFAYLRGWGIYILFIAHIQHILAVFHSNVFCNIMFSITENIYSTHCCLNYTIFNYTILNCTVFIQVLIIFFNIMVFVQCNNALLCNKGEVRGTCKFNTQHDSCTYHSIALGRSSNTRVLVYPAETPFISLCTF